MAKEFSFYNHKCVIISLKKMNVEGSLKHNIHYFVLSFDLFDPIDRIDTKNNNAFISTRELSYWILK